MPHDDLCPQYDQTEHSIAMFDTPCRCEEYARVRADERARAYPGREVRSQLIGAYAQLSHAEAVAAKLVEVIRVDDLRLRTQKGHTAQARRERDAARAEVERLRSPEWEAEVRADERAKVYRPDAHRMMLERDAARAEVAALREQIENGEAIARGMVAQARREVLADLREQVLMLEHDDSCSEIRQEAPCDCLRGSVLALIEEAGQ